MTRPAISVENLSKAYRIGLKEEIPDTLTEAVLGFVKSPWKKFRELQRLNTFRNTEEADDTFWALKDVSFDVQEGEVLGVIGRNGAGKSTLLKILSRITEPTSGRAVIRGRVSSLLEVGTGFHPELSGRENVYLNGTILGMTKPEIDRKFDEIVDFSGVEKFLDTPIKRYSSGMKVRLAFAVAAHLEPEILIIDEVLAVGDATYQKRCVDRMARLATEGRTILFVSHSLDLIERLCSKGLLLSEGQVRAEGSLDDVMRNYLSEANTDCAEQDLKNHVHSGDGRARFAHIASTDHTGRLCTTFPIGNDLVVRVTVEVFEVVGDAAIAIVLSTSGGSRIITSWTREASFHIDLTPGVHFFECRFRNMLIRPSHRLSIGLWMESGTVLDCVQDALQIKGGHDLSGAQLSPDLHQGVIAVPYLWSRT